jgi:NADH-quinone oxidoreductase subunit A
MRRPGAEPVTAVLADLGSYFPILLLFGVVAAFATLSLIASSFLRPSRPTRPKAEPYESGIEVDPMPRGQRFPVKFYVVAMLFIVFDIETIFLFPWAVSFRELGVFGLIEMAVFIALVFVAYVYVWKKGGLDWSEVERRRSIVLAREEERVRARARSHSDAAPSEEGARAR